MGGKNPVSLRATWNSPRRAGEGAALAIEVGGTPNAELLFRSDCYGESVRSRPKFFAAAADRLCDEVRKRN